MKAASWTRHLSLFSMEESERKPFVWASLYLFCILASSYVIRPLQSNISATAAFAKVQAWLITATAVLAFALTPLYGFLTSRFSRKRLITVVYGVLLIGLGGFYLALSRLSGTRQVWASHAFWMWANIFNVFVVSVFWDLMVDLFRPSQGRRFFSLVGILGTLGSLLGALVTMRWMQWLRNHPSVSQSTAMLGGALFLVLALLCMFRLHHHALAMQPVTQEEDQRPPGKNTWSGIRHVVFSPYLRGMAGYTLVLAMATGSLFLQQRPIVGAMWPESLPDFSLQITIYYAKLDLLINGVALFLQLTVSRYLLMRAKASQLMLILPVVFLMGMLAMKIVPALGFVAPVSSLVVITVVHVLIRSSEFAIVKPARKALFTMVSRDDKYSAQSFIDTFVHRMGDLELVWLVEGARYAFGWGVSALVWALLPLWLGWTLVSWWLGGRQIQLAPASEKSSP